MICGKEVAPPSDNDRDRYVIIRKLQNYIFNVAAVFIYIHSFIHQWLYSPLLGPGLFFSFVILSQPQSLGNPYLSLMLRPTVQSASLSWNKASVWGLRPDFYYCQTVAGLLMWGARAVSLTRGRVCRLQLLLAVTSAVILGYESRGTRVHILLSQIRDFPFRRLL
jgi:hypothetical protein